MDAENIRCHKVLAAKMDRANQHITEIERLRLEFAKRVQIEGIGRKYDCETRQLTLYIKETIGIPVAISILAGEAIQQLRSCLDYVIWRHVEFRDKTQLHDNLCFPICETLQAFRSWNGQVSCLPKSYRRILKCMQPYGAPTLQENALWCLKELDDSNKHRRIYITSVMVAAKGFSVADYQSIQITRMYGVEPTADADILVGITDDPYVNVDLSMTADIMIDEARITGKKEIITILNGLYGCVFEVLNQAAQFLRE